jgi:hypothetical protein
MLHELGFLGAPGKPIMIMYLSSLEKGKDDWVTQ